MGLICKQLVKQLAKNKVYLALLFLLTTATSLSFFFVMFSIDGNMAKLNTLPGLTENQMRYKNALTANTGLAFTFLVSSAGLTSFVIVMFFYRFFKANSKQIGCIKALGFKDIAIRAVLVLYITWLSITGSILGVVGGFFLSDILVDANTRNYKMSGLVSRISPDTAILGMGLPTGIFCLTTWLCYGFIKDKEVGLLLASNTRRIAYPLTLRIADRVSKFAPQSRRLPLRIALRKPVSLLLMVGAVTSFVVCMVLGQSLNLSSKKIFDTQMEGHNYGYDVRYEGYQTADFSDHAIAYIDNDATFSVKDHELERIVTGLYRLNELYELKDKDGRLLDIPRSGAAYINLELAEIYGVKVGDTLTAAIEGSRQTFVVEAVAVNAKARCIYVNGVQLSEMLGVTAGAYNGLLSERMRQGDAIVSRAERIDELNRGSVSNQVSAVINQATGAFVGIVLIFLALYINFQDNSRDMLILRMMGHTAKEIQKMLVNVYLPILWFSFGLALAPGVLLARTIQNSLAISTNDYIPFSVNGLVVLVSFVLVNLIYLAVQATFGLGVRRLVARGAVDGVVHVD